MLQTASDWWWGSDAKEKEEGDDTNDNKASTEDKDDKTETKSENDDDEPIDIEFEKELQSITCLDAVLCLFKLIHFENGVKNMLSKQFPSDQLTEDESKGIYDLFTKIHQQGIGTKAQLTVYSELKIGEIILSFFASKSHTNPDAIGCWIRWLKYRMIKEVQIGLNNVTTQNLQKFYDSQTNEFGWDKKGRFIWFVSTEKYDGWIDDDTQRKGYMLLLMSYLWDIKTNTFNLNTLRNGVQSHLDLSHFSMSLVSWSTTYAIKDCLVAFPYALKDIFIVNPPMLLYLVKTVAAQFFTAHSLDKFILLEDEDQYFKYATKEKTPVIAKGAQELTVSLWMKQKGYL